MRSTILCLSLALLSSAGSALPTPLPNATGVCEANPNTEYVQADVGGLKLRNGSSTLQRSKATTIGGTDVATIKPNANENSLRDFGAIGDGVADDTDAIQRWLDSLGIHRHGTIPTGIYKFTHPLVALTSGVAITGDGPYQSVLSYEGSAGSGDLITIGDGNREVSNWTLTNIRVASNTKMTAGSALRLRKVVRSALSDVTIDGQDGNGNLWDGIWFDSVDFLTVQRFEARSQQDAVRINGAVGQGPKADLMLSYGKIGGAAIGLHVGGAFGGLFIDNLDIIGNQRNVLIDTSLAREGNRELFFGPNTAIDSASRGCAITMSDSLANSAAWLQFSGTWIASGPDCGLLIDSGVKSVISLEGGTIFNFKSDGIRNLANNVTLLVAGVVLRNNLGPGINTIQEKETLQNGVFIKNRGGDILRHKP